MNVSILKRCQVMLSMLKLFIKCFLIAGPFFLLSCAQTNEGDQSNEKPGDNDVDKEVINENYQAELQRNMSGLRQMDERNQELKRKKEEKETKEWLYGNWEYNGYDEWIGRYVSYVCITENKLRTGYNGQEMYDGPYEIDMGSSQIIFDHHDGYYVHFDLDLRKQRLSDGEGHYFKKVNRPVGTSSSSGYGKNSYNSSSQSNVQFRTDSDVIAYTSSHTFKNNIGNRIKIDFQGLYINGSLVTNAPRVLNFNGSTATISVSSPYTGGGAMIISVDASRGTITDGSGDVFWMVN